MGHVSTAAESFYVGNSLSQVDVDDDFYDYVKTLSPAAIDLEIRSLVTLDAQHLFLTSLIQRLRSRRDFEAIQTFQNIFLRIHGEVLVANEESRVYLERLKEVQTLESERVVELLASSLGTLAFVRETY